MFEAIRRWRERRILAASAIPDALWREALAALPFLAIYTEPELARLRERVVLFLHAKSIVGAHGFEVTPLMRVTIAIQACVLILNLDASYYDGWENIIVYPDEFVTRLEYEDEAGVVHLREEPLAGEAMSGGPVVLSWPDVEASRDWVDTGMNLVIHEFAHKIDMKNGEANGSPPLPPEIPPAAWRKTMSDAYAHFGARVDREGEATEIDPYAADSPAEFFAVLSEVFFAEPALLQAEYPGVYDLFTRFYRQDPASRIGVALER